MSENDSAPEDDNYENRYENCIITRNDDSDTSSENSSSTDEPQTKATTETSVLEGINVGPLPLKLNKKDSYVVMLACLYTLEKFFVEKSLDDEEMARQVAVVKLILLNSCTSFDIEHVNFRDERLYIEHKKPQSTPPIKTNKTNKKTPKKKLLIKSTAMRLGQKKVKMSLNNKKQTVAHNSGSPPRVQKTKSDFMDKLQLSPSTSESPVKSPRKIQNNNLRTTKSLPIKKKVNKSKNISQTVNKAVMQEDYATSTVRRSRRLEGASSNEPLDKFNILRLRIQKALSKSLTHDKLENIHDQEPKRNKRQAASFCGTSSKKAKTNVSTNNEPNTTRKLRLLYTPESWLNSLNNSNESQKN